MVQVIHFWVFISSGSGTRSMVPLQGFPNPQLTAGAGAVPLPVPGSFTNFRVANKGGVLPGANATISLFHAGSVSNLSDVLTTSVASFTDTDTLSVAAGDTLEFRAVTGASTGALFLQCAVDFEATAADTSIHSFGDASTAIGAVGVRDALLGGGNWSNNTENYSIISTPGDVTTYRVKLNVAPGVGNSRTFHLYKNSTKQDGTGGTPNTGITISDTATTGSASFSLPTIEGDHVWVEYTAAGGSPSASRVMGTCAFVSTTAGRWNGNLLSNTGPQTSETPPAYYFPLGHCELTAWSSTTEADREMRNGPTACWLWRMRAETSNAPGSGGDAWVFKLRVNQSDSTQACTVTDAATSDGPASGAAVELTDNDLFAIRWEELVTPGNCDGVHLAWEFSEADPTPAPSSDFNALLIAP